MGNAKQTLYSKSPGDCWIIFNKTLTPSRREVSKKRRFCILLRWCLFSTQV